MKETRICRECGKRLPSGNSIISYAARKLGYCRYCYKMNFPMRPLQEKQAPLYMEYSPEIDHAESFNPDSPWDWYEMFFPEMDR